MHPAPLGIGAGAHIVAVGVAADQALEHQDPNKRNERQHQRERVKYQADADELQKAGGGEELANLQGYLVSVNKN